VIDIDFDLIALGGDQIAAVEAVVVLGLLECLPREVASDFLAVQVIDAELWEIADFNAVAAVAAVASVTSVAAVASISAVAAVASVSAVPSFPEQPASVATPAMPSAESHCRRPMWRLLSSVPSVCRRNIPSCNKWVYKNFRYSNIFGDMTDRRIPKP